MQQRNDTSALELFDPCGTVSVQVVRPAARPHSLAGLRLGVLDNSKWNANKLLRAAAGELAARFGLDFAYRVKHSFSQDAAADLIALLARESDVVLTAIGDCGSCCSACIRDAVALEKLGIPTAAVITTEFVKEAELTLSALGMPELALIRIAHPVSSITQEQLASRVGEITRQAPAVWLGRPAPGEGRGQWQR